MSSPSWWCPADRGSSCDDAMTIESGDELALLVARSPAGRGNGRGEDLVAGRHGQASGWWRSFGRIEGGERN